jgi:hypothetical protein
MNGTLDTNFGEDRSVYMAKVVGKAGDRWYHRYFTNAFRCDFAYTFRIRGLRNHHEIRRYSADDIIDP